MGQITTWDEFPTIEYVPGVFRQTVSGEKTMLTRIVYRGGVVIPAHFHPAEQLMLVEQGRLWAKVGEEEAEVGPGSLLVIPSDCVHAFRQLSDEDVVFYEAFAPIRLEYLIGYKGPDKSLGMIERASRAPSPAPGAPSVATGPAPGGVAAYQPPWSNAQDPAGSAKQPASTTLRAARSGPDSDRGRRLPPPRLVDGEESPSTRVGRHQRCGESQRETIQARASPR